MMTRYRIETIVETSADLIEMNMVEGNYNDGNEPDRFFATCIKPYEADEGRRIVSFRIEKAERAN